MGSLSLSPSQLAELLDATTSALLDFQRGLDQGTHPASYVHDSLDAGAYHHGRAASQQLREDTPPSTGTPITDLMAELFGPAMSNGTMHPHPGFMAHVPSGGLIEGAVGDFIARAVNRYAGVWLAAPGFQQLETNVIRWFCTMLGYGEGSFGYLTTGGSIANLMALACTDRTPQATYYVSAQGHFSVAKAARIAGIPADRVRVINTGPTYAMDTAELTARIAADRADGLRPTCVVATAGTTNTGAIDDLAGIAELCRRERLWLHVDACFGGFFRITERGRTALRGIEQADSIAVDGHKSLFLPHGSSALLVKNRATLKDAFEVPGADYLPGFIDEPDLVDFCRYGPELSREIRGLTAWLPLKVHGLPAFRQTLDEKLDLAEHLAEQLVTIAGIEVIQRHPLHLPVVNFRLPEGDNARLCELICAHGNVYLTTTRLPGYGLVVRACILHHRTDLAVVEQLLDDVRWAVTNVNRAVA